MKLLNCCCCCSIPVGVIILISLDIILCVLNIIAVIVDAVDLANDNDSQLGGTAVTGGFLWISIAYLAATKLPRAVRGIMLLANKNIVR